MFIGTLSAAGVIRPNSRNLLTWLYLYRYNQWVKHELRPIRYTHHARERMIERRISQAEVEQVIRTGARQPDGVNKWIAFGTINARRLEVAYLETEEGELQVLLVLSFYERRY